MTTADRPIVPTRNRAVLGIALAAIVAAAVLSGAAGACADPVDLQVVDRQTGKPLKVWRHNGRLFIAGQPGTHYALRVTNHTEARVLVVLSVDGVNIVSGETAGYDQRGYIFKPHQSDDLKGWRKSTTEIAAFVFAPLPQSYAARTGRPADVGVIGMAVFNEKPDAPTEVYVAPETRSARPAKPDAGASDFAARLAAPPPAPPPPPPPADATTVGAVIVTSQRRAAAPSGAVAGLVAQQKQDKLGTAHGDREYSVSNVEPFERATDTPMFVRQFEYDTYDNLVAAGVIHRSWTDEHRPRPFPSQPGGEGYVPDPPPE